jgi:hypothetical protein
METKHTQVSKRRQFSFKNLPHVALTPQLGKMASKIQNAKYLFWFQGSKSVITLQRKFLAEYDREAPPKMSIRK